MIEVACPACGHKLKTRDDLAGKKVRRPHCGQPAAIPPAIAATEAVAATLPPAPAAADAATLPPSSPAADDRTARRPGNGETPSRGGERPTVPGYEILGELGRGGMGVVYKARQVRLRRLVALKMILAGGHAGESELARFRSEAEAVARLQHPNIVQIHEIGEQGGLPFFSLEFIDGGTLAGQLDGTPWPGDRAARMVETLARAMQAAHAHQIIHRDLKPANVLLTADGAAKITDFGLAKQLDEESGQTQAGQIMGKALGPPFAQQSYIYSAAFGKDGSTVLTAHDDGTARLWSAPRGKPMQPKGEPLVHDSPVRIVAFSDNGKTFLTCAGKTARLWNAATRKPIGAPLAHTHNVMAAAFSPDNKTVVTAALQTARLWDSAKGNPRGSLPAPPPR